MTTRKRLTQIAVSLALAAMGLVFTPPLSSAQTVAAAPTAKPKTVSKTPARANKSTKKKKAYSATSARERRAQLNRARAAARARELRELQTPRFTVDEFGREVPDVRAEAAIIFNPETGEILWENHAKDQRSIASITKVMTALVFLESGAPLDQMVTVQRSDVSRASTTYLRNGFKLTAEDLLNLLLVGSDNAAARALARISPMGYDGFIESMNNRARHLGLESTTYADPSGLLAENMSSAYDQARLIATAAANAQISEIMRKSSYTTNIGKRQITANSTNQIVRSGDIDVVGGKTGFISRSGYCLATLLRLPQSGQQVAFVVLGAKTNASRFWETRHLFNWMSTRTKALLEGDFQQQQQQQLEQFDYN
jgi:D-alanyl-D-alanine endopeptidase (penicillin-binding protein 7)